MSKLPINPGQGEITNCIRLYIYIYFHNRFLDHFHASISTRNIKDKKWCTSCIRYSSIFSMMWLFVLLLVIIMIVKSAAELQAASSGNQKTFSSELDTSSKVDELKIIVSNYLEMVNTELRNTKHQVVELQVTVSDNQETVSSELEDTRRKVGELQVDISGNQESVSSELEDTRRKVDELKIAVSNNQETVSSELADTNRKVEKLEESISALIKLLTASSSLPKDCSGILLRDITMSGVYTVQHLDSGDAFHVYCDRETDIGGSTVAKMVSFNGPYGGYVSRTPIDLNGDSDMIFRFRTNEPDGVMIYASSADKSQFVAVMIVSSYVHVFADGGSDSIDEVQSTQDGYNDGEWHTVFVSKRETKLTLTVDDSDSAFSRFQKGSMKTDAYFLIGGFPRSDFIAAAILPRTNNFIGCISDLAVGFQAVSFSDQIICDNNANLNVCSIGSMSPVTASSNTASPDLTQDTIPTPPSATTQGPKLRSCALPRVASAQQQLAGDIGAQKFGTTEETRLEFPALDQKYKRNLEMLVELKTTARNGLIMYSADSRRIDYTGIFMRDGKVVFGWDYGSGSKLIESPDPINDGNWHTVRASRVGAVGELYIDDQSISRDEIGGSNRFLRTTTPIYFGGVHPEVRDSMKDTHVDPASRVSFVGCLRNFLVDGTSLGEPVENVGVQPCTWITEPGVFFGSDGGYITLNSTFTVGRNFYMHMSIKPRVFTAILMSVQSTSGDFLSMELLDGVLFLRAENCDGVSEAAYTPSEGSTYLCDGNWHDIRVIKEEHILQLIVDGDPGPRVERSRKTVTTNTRHPLFFGGLPDNLETEHRGISTTEKFVGCMRNVTVRGSLLNFKWAAEISGDVNTMSCPA